MLDLAAELQVKPNTVMRTYNIALRSEYRKGDYKDPLRGYASRLRTSPK